MNWFNQFSVIQIVSGSAVVMILLILTVSGLYTGEKYQTLNSARQDSELIQLIGALEQVAHHHAVERGLTAGFLGNPSQSARHKVTAQRDKADMATEALYPLLARSWPTSFKIEEKTQALQDHLQDKAVLRRKVDNLNGADAFMFYSTLNQLALEAAGSVSLSIQSPLAGSELGIALKFAQLKERTGQLRGKINGILSSRNATTETLSQIKLFSAQASRIADELSNQLTGAEKIQFSDLQGSDESQTMQRVISALTDNPDFTALPSPDTWFSTATRQIGNVKTLLDDQWDKIKTEARDRQAVARNTIIGLLISVTTVTCVVVLMYWAMLSMLRKQLAMLTGAMTQISEGGDLTVKVALRSNSELGIIAKALNNTIAGLRDLITGLISSIEASRALSNTLDSTSREIVTDAKSTEQKALNIASAIEQMAATSTEIAQAAVNTLDAARSLDSMANESKVANDKIRSAMESLSGDMQNVEVQAGQMEQQVSDISMILDEINGLSDQTNLLALNAAIEAARAGEHGRGFAVVADEVRKLAIASRESSDRISALLTNLQKASVTVVQGINTSARAAADSVAITQEGEQTAQQVKDGAANVEQMANSMSAAAEQQSVTAAQIAQDIVQVQEAASQELTIAESLRKLAEDMSKNNQLLSNTMSNFKV